MRCLLLPERMFSTLSPDWKSYTSSLPAGKFSCSQLRIVFPVKEKVVRVPVLIASTNSVEVPGVRTAGLCAIARQRVSPYAIAQEPYLAGFMVGLGWV